MMLALALALGRIRRVYLPSSVHCKYLLGTLQKKINYNFKYGTNICSVLIKFAANLLIVLQEWAETEKDLIKGDDKL